MIIVQVGLPNRPEAVRVARQAVECLRGHVDDSALDNLRLLVSEVVTNSVRHAPRDKENEEDCIKLTVMEDPDQLRVEVDDPGSGFDPDVQAPREGQLSGWGLFLVDQIASEWGVDAHGATKVWFALPRSGGETARPRLTTRRRR